VPLAASARQLHAEAVLEPNALALALVVALAVGLIVVARRSRLGGRLPGSFGQGFVGFRVDGWPRGVQEDDDARWSWPGLAATASGVRSGPGAVSGAGVLHPRRPPIPPTRPQR
jgi:hypothetical protein